MADLRRSRRVQEQRRNRGVDIVEGQQNNDQHNNNEMADLGANHDAADDGDAAANINAANINNILNGQAALLQQMMQQMQQQHHQMQQQQQQVQQVMQMLQQQGAGGGGGPPGGGGGGGGPPGGGGGGGAPPGGGGGAPPPGGPPPGGGPPPAGGGGPGGPPGGGGGGPPGGGGGGPPGGGGGGPPAGGAAGAGSFSPYGIRLNLDGSNRQHWQQYEAAVRPFTNQFDGEMSNFATFKDNVEQRANKLKCRPIFDVIHGGGILSIIDRYGTIPMHVSKQTALARWSNDDWARQASFIMGQCLSDSLTEEFRSRVIRYKDEYTMQDPTSGTLYSDGALFYHVICRIVSPSTLYTSQSIFESLQTLRPVDFDNNIIKFHEAFLKQRQTLMAGQGGMDLSNDVNMKHYLLKAYRTVSCNEFKNFVERLQERPFIDLNTMIQEAEAKYNELVREELWGKPSDREVIVALMAAKEKKEKDKKKPLCKRTNKKDKLKKKATKKLKQVEREDRAWMHVPPKKGKEGDVITRDNKKWNWCKHHNQYVLVNGKMGKHTSDTCRLNPKNGNKDGDQKRKKKEKEVTVNQAGVEDESDDSADSDSDDSETETEDETETSGSR